MKDRLIGLDINGWHDFAVRNWHLDSDGIERSVLEGHVVDGGPVSRVVYVGDKPVGDKPGKPVGGPRAQLAMHGKGAGWGDFGAEDRRVLIRRSDDPKAWSECMKELGYKPRIAVLAIPDLAAMDELAREIRLDAMRGLHARRTMLVWSSVALALHLCHTNKVKDGQRLGVIELDNRGIRLQDIDIVERDMLLSPRRRSVGRLIESDLGLGERERKALVRVKSDNVHQRLAGVLNLADLPALLAMSKPGDEISELIRLENGDWTKISGKALYPHIDHNPKSSFAQVDHIVLHGPVETGLLHAVRTELEWSIGKKIEVAEPSAVAFGAFRVAERLKKGLPPWFDYLPNVETIVQSDEEVKSLSLVKQGEDAEAGKVWRSPQAVKLRWQAKSQSIEVWLKKEGDPKPRSSPATVQNAPDLSQEVHLFLEQQPAQGRAKLRITADKWPILRDRPAVVDWDKGTHDPDGRDWEEIIRDFKKRPPVIPERVILPAHSDLWYPEEGKGLAEALRAFDGKNYTPVYRALMARRQVYFDQSDHPQHKRIFYAVDSDGGRAACVDDKDWYRLLEVISDAEADFTCGRVKNNHALGVLSWCFRQCPKGVWPIVIRVLRHEGGYPSFPGWRIMYPQALGRIAEGEEAFEAAIEYLNCLEHPWTRDQQACASFLLSRNDKIFDLLDQETIDRWSNAAIQSLQAGVDHGFSQKQYYTPIFIAGLLRWRRREPHAFTPTHGSKAETLAKLLTETLLRDDISAKAHDAYENVLAAIRDKGVRPDLLQTLFDLL